MTRLGRTVPLMHGEVPHGFTSRLAACYKISALQFCGEMGTTLRGVVDGRDEPLRRIADVANVSVENLARSVLRRSENGRSWTIRGQKVDKEALRRTRLHACAACLKTDIEQSTLSPEKAAFFRTEWLLEPIRTCATHGMGLMPVDKPPTGGWKSVEIYDLAARINTAIPDLDRLIESAPKRNAPSHQIYLTNRIEGNGLPSSWLDTLPWYVASKTCEMLGAVCLFGRMPNLNKLTEMDWCRAGDAGFEIASGGEASIRRFLAELQRNAARSATEGPQAIFGRIYQWLAFSAKVADYDQVRDLVRVHIIETMPVGTNETVLGKTVTQRRVHSIRSASLETGCHPKRLRKILANGGFLPDGHEDKMDIHVTFDAKAAAEFLHASMRQVSLKDVRAYLNAPRVHANLLAKNGFITPFVTSKGKMAFAKADLDDFINCLQGEALHDVERTKSMHTIPAAAKRANCGAAEIVELILAHRLKHVCLDPKESGYLSVLVDVDELKPFVQGPAMNGVTEHQACEIMKVGDRTIKALTRHGILEKHPAINPINRCPIEVIRLESLEAFQREYVTLFQIAKARKQHMLTVQKELRRLEITPAFEREQFFSTFYRRADLV